MNVGEAAVFAHRTAGGTDGGDAAGGGTGRLASAGAGSDRSARTCARAEAITGENSLCYAELPFIGNLVLGALFSVSMFAGQLGS